MSITLYSLCGTDAARPFSPHCWKIVMALAHKGLPFEERPLPFTAIPQIENGASATVPLIRDGDRLVSDSFQIALYLDEAYPEQPSLFNGDGGKALARFVEGYSQTVLHPAATKIGVKMIHDMLDPVDRAYFRRTREGRLGATLEEITANRDAEIAAFPAKLEPLRHMLKFQPFLGGESPLFADYIVVGLFQWLRITTGSTHLSVADPVALWLDRCLDLFGGRARAVA